MLFGVDWVGVVCFLVTIYLAIGLVGMVWAFLYWITQG